VDIFSPYQPIIAASVFSSLFVFYLVGAFFTPRLSTPKRNIAVRMAIGSLVFTFGIAITHAGYKTMLLPFGFFLPFLFTPFPKGVLSDIKAIGNKQLLTILVAYVSILLFEMWVADLRQGKDIVVKNWDYANSGAFGFEYLSGSIETSRFVFNHINKQVIHHFGDHWLAGFYSHIPSILPYYSYVVIYRVLMEAILLLLMLAWWQGENTKGLHYIAGIIVFTLFMPGLRFLRIEPIEVVDMLWSCSHYLMLAMWLLAMCLLIYEQHTAKGYAGLMLSALINPLAATFLLIASVLALVSSLIKNRYKKVWTPQDITPAIALIGTIAASAIFIYILATNRSARTEINLLHTDNIIKITVMLVGMLVANILVLPFFYGLKCLSTLKNNNTLFLLILFCAIGAAISQAIMFGSMGGDTIQIWIAFGNTLLIPIGGLGLLQAATQQKKVAFACIALCLLSSVAVALNFGNARTLSQSIDYLSGSDNEWKTCSKMSHDEALKLYHVLNKPTLINVGIGICSKRDTPLYDESIYMHPAPYLRAFTPGAEFYRITLSQQDTSDLHDIPLNTFIQQSYLYHFNFHEKSSNSAERMIEELNIQCLLLDSINQDWCIPQGVEAMFPRVEKTGRYTLLWRE